MLVDDAEQSITWRCRDGLNRYPMEYTLARQQFGEDPDLKASIGLPSQGIVLISEFISSARVMRGGLVVNPWKIDEVYMPSVIELSA